MFLLFILSEDAAKFPRPGRRTCVQLRVQKTNARSSPPRRAQEDRLRLIRVIGAIRGKGFSSQHPPRLAILLQFAADSLAS